MILETPQTAPEMVWFQEDNYHELNPNELRVRWDKTNLTIDETAKVRISVWGYREDTVNPKLEFIDLIAVTICSKELKNKVISDRFILLVSVTIIPEIR